MNDASRVMSDGQKLSPRRVRLMTFAVMVVVAVAAICLIDRRAMMTPGPPDAPADVMP